MKKPSDNIPRTIFNEPVKLKANEIYKLTLRESVKPELTEFIIDYPNFNIKETPAKIIEFMVGSSVGFYGEQKHLIDRILSFQMIPENPPDNLALFGYIYIHITATEDLEIQLFVNVHDYSGFID